MGTLENMVDVGQASAKKRVMSIWTKDNSSRKEGKTVSHRMRIAAWREWEKVNKNLFLLLNSCYIRSFSFSSAKFYCKPTSDVSGAVVVRRRKENE